MPNSKQKIMQRRNFLKNTALGAVMPSIFGGYGVNAVGLSPWMQSLTNAAAETDHVLVIIQLSGGNDGLNMVIPLDQYTNLATARGNILINENQVLRLNGVTATGLHPAMTGLRDLYNGGRLKIIQGVSYPTPNYSHFRATDIWQTASDSKQVLETGWLGRYLGTEYPNYPTGYPNQTMPHPLAIQLGSSLAVAFQGGVTAMGITISDPSTFYNIVNNTNDPLPPGYMGKELSYLRTVARQTQQYGQVLQTAYQAGANLATYPTPRTGLADQLKIVARLIKGGLKTRVYMMQTGGYDTHSAQVDANDHAIGSHANLLKTLSEAIIAFQTDLDMMRLDGRVLGMTFSEFGRRIKSNASSGTDHGAAEPMFVFGSPLFGGVLGSNPTIAGVTGVNDNLPMQYDFRSVYASILKDWFCVNATDLNTIMLQNFQQLRIVNSPTCITPTHEENVAAGISLISNYPNPFSSTTTIEFQTTGGHTMVQVFDTEGRLMATPVDGDYVEGKYKVYFNAERLPSGIYYGRLQNGAVQQVKTMLKVR
jgi:uncharacterized protein (DUF1501 family)